MKSPYKFVDGQAVEIEVNSAVAEQLAVFAREDENAACKKRWRNEISLDALHEETEWELTDAAVDIESDYFVREETEFLQTAIKKLSEKQQRLIQLYYYEEKKLREIAVILGIHFSCVQRQLETIHKRLKEIFNDF